MCYLKVLKSIKTNSASNTLYPNSKSLKQNRLIVNDYHIYLQDGTNSFKRKHCICLGRFGGK